MSLDFNNIVNLLKNGKIDLNKLKDGEGENNTPFYSARAINSLGKTTDVNSIWNESGDGYNENLMDRESFVDSLYNDDGINAYSREELGQIYDLVSAFDGAEGLTGEELEKLASFDGNGDKLNAKDINDFLEALETESKKAKVAEDAASEETTDQAAQPAAALAEANAGAAASAKVSDNTYDDSGIDRTSFPYKTAEGEDIGPNITAPVDSEAIFQVDDRIKADENNQRYVNVESWSSNDDSNNCLSRIINNSYDLEAMGIELYSEEYYALEKAVMDANPEIYGTEDGGWRKEVGGIGRHNAVIYTNDKVFLPDWEGTGAADEADGTDNQTTAASDAATDCEGGTSGTNSSGECSSNGGSTSSSTSTTECPTVPSGDIDINNIPNGGAVNTTTSDGSSMTIINNGDGDVNAIDDNSGVAVNGDNNVVNIDLSDNSVREELINNGVIQIADDGSYIFNGDAFQQYINGDGNIIGDHSGNTIYNITDSSRTDNSRTDNSYTDNSRTYNDNSKTYNDNSTTNIDNSTTNIDNSVTNNINITIVVNPAPTPPDPPTPPDDDCDEPEDDIPTDEDEPVLPDLPSDDDTKPTPPPDDDTKPTPPQDDDINYGEEVDVVEPKPPQDTDTPTTEPDKPATEPDKPTTEPDEPCDDNPSEDIPTTEPEPELPSGDETPTVPVTPEEPEIPETDTEPDTPSADTETEVPPADTEPDTPPCDDTASEDVIVEEQVPSFDTAAYSEPDYNSSYSEPSYETPAYSEPDYGSSYSEPLYDAPTYSEPDYGSSDYTGGSEEDVSEPEEWNG